MNFMLRMLVGPAVVLSTSITLVSAAPTTQAADVDPAALVREVRAKEAWIDHAKSLRLRLDTRWTKSPRAIEDRKSELKKRFPRAEIDEEHFSELKSESKGILELAFDDHRMYVHTEEPDASRVVNDRIWDGKTASMYERYKNGREIYGLDREEYRYIGQFFMGYMAWPEGGPHQYWWEPAERRTGDSFWGRPEDFRAVGRANVHSIDCYVLETDTYFRTLYVGVADHRLYGAKDRVVPRDALEKEREIDVQLAREFHHEVRDIREFETWRSSLPQPTREKIEREHWKRLRSLSVPHFAFWYSEYRELAPNCWFPSRQSYDLFKTETTIDPLITTSRVLTLIDASVNQPLPDDLFKMDFKEGVQVTDWRHDPPLIYKYKKHFAPEEWQAILEEAQKRKESLTARKGAMDSILGKPAPDFGGAIWVNSKPLKWKDLKGKIVLIDFWATWCVPCRNDYPKLVELYRQREQNKFVIVGIHAAGTPMAEVKKMMKDFGIEYPVCIDTDEREGSRFGKLFQTYRIGMLPHVFVVDQDGRIESHGTLAEAVEAARKLADK